MAVAQRTESQAPVERQEVLVVRRNGVDALVEGPRVDGQTREHHYVVRGGEREIRFRVIPEEAGEDRGWAVRIEGVPAPSIVHERPWESVPAARDAAIRAIATMLWLERVQREEAERR
jgi:hypothetical protein